MEKPEWIKLKQYTFFAGVKSGILIYNHSDYYQMIWYTLRASFIHLFKQILRNLVAKNPLCMQWTQVCSLVRELRSSMPQSNQVHAPQLLKLTHRGASKLQLVGPYPQLESPCATTEDPTWPNKDPSGFN